MVNGFENVENNLYCNRNKKSVLKYKKTTTTFLFVSKIRPLILYGEEYVKYWSRSIYHFHLRPKVEAGWIAK